MIDLPLRLFCVLAQTNNKISTCRASKQCIIGDFLYNNVVVLQRERERARQRDGCTACQTVVVFY